MRKFTYRSRQEAEDAAKSKESECHRLRIGLAAVLAGNVQGTFRRAPYTVRLVGAERCEGGIVLVTFAPKGQKPLTDAHYLDEYYRDISHNAARSPDPEYGKLASLLAEASRRRFEILHPTPQELV